MPGPVVLSCRNQGSQTLKVIASAKGIDKTDALFNLIDRILTAAQAKVKCDDQCADSGDDVFCYATLTFKGAVQYVRKPGFGVIAYYSGKATMQCHCFQFIEIELVDDDDDE
jgi:hypothetical protein